MLANLETKKKTQLKEKLPEGFKKCICSPDGTYFVAIGGMSNSILRYWAFGEGKALRIRASGAANLEGNATLYDGAFSPDGRIFATVSGSGNLDFWSRPPIRQMRNGKNLTRNGGLSGVAISRDGKKIAVAALWEPKITLVTTATGDVLQEIPWKK